MTVLARYDAMVTAIAECERVDEAKDIRDKAIALEAYYRQARNLEAERQAANVRLRAERRTGELSRELARAESPNPEGAGGKSGKIVTSDDRTQQSPYAEMLSRTGMSRQQANRYEALANVPEDEFESALADPAKPTTNGILARAKLKADPPQPKVSDEALWLWGRLRDFERMGYLENPPGWAMESMTDAMRADVIRLAEQVSQYLEQIGGTIHEYS